MEIMGEGVLPPMDFGFEYGLTVRDWINDTRSFYNLEGKDLNRIGYIEHLEIKIKQYKRAYTLYKTVGDNLMRQEPMVFTNIKFNDHYESYSETLFIFKDHNNGNTIVIRDREDSASDREYS